MNKGSGMDGRAKIEAAIGRSLSFYDIMHRYGSPYALGIEFDDNNGEKVRLATKIAPSIIDINSGVNALIAWSLEILNETVSA
jgi:hypothetical protein